MTARTGEITLQDLLTWEPRLRLLPGGFHRAADDPRLNAEVDWVISARASAPMLPILRGGELVLLTQRVVSESGVPFPMLIQQLEGRPVAGVVTDLPLQPMLDTAVTVLTTPAIAPEFESELNRLLTTRRGDLLRTGADLERLISELLSRNTRPADLLDQISRRLGIGITIAMANGTTVLTTLSSEERPPLGRSGSITASISRTPSSGDTPWSQYPLRADRVLWLGPIAPSQRALARLVGSQIHDGIQRAIDQDDATAPRGAARARALNELLVQHHGDPQALEASALRAGLPAGTPLRIAMHPASMPEEMVQRRLAVLGTTHDAGMIDGFTVRVVTSHHVRPIGARPVSTLDGQPWIALSAPIASARFLPDATRQARYIAGLADRGMLSGQDLRFDDEATLGAYALLFDRWGSPSLTRYIDQLIGELLREDRRGLLRETLRVYLEHGGAQRSTSDQLAIHRNTLTYRLRQIRKILRLDPDDPTARLGLHLALLATELPPAPDNRA